MCSVSHKVIYIVLQFSGNSPARISFFLQCLPISSEGLEQVKLSNIVKMGKIYRALSKLRLTTVFIRL